MGELKMAEDFSKMGGRAVPLMGADPNDPNSIGWNFGVKPKTPDVEAMIKATPTLYGRFPNLQGRWDGKTVNHWLAVQKVLTGTGGSPKPEDLIQMQPRGTCGGRSGSLGLDLLQCILIASGKRARFKRVSHAALYFWARRKYGMLSGHPSDDSEDGVAGGSIPEIMGEVGAVTREEVSDTNYYGQGSDDLACQWGAGRISPDLARKIDELAKDNVVTAKVRVKSAEELADGLAAGGIGIGSDGQGYTMQRDEYGCCAPRGTWWHYHVRAGVRKDETGRTKGIFDYYQSWGKNNPTGPLLPGCPPNAFGVDWNTQDRCCKNGEWDVVFSFEPFELERGTFDISWIF